MKLKANCTKTKTSKTQTRPRTLGGQCDISLFALDGRVLGLILRLLILRIQTEPGFTVCRGVLHRHLRLFSACQFKFTLRVCEAESKTWSLGIAQVCTSWGDPSSPESWSGGPALECGWEV